VLERDAILSKISFKTKNGDGALDSAPEQRTLLPALPRGRPILKKHLTPLRSKNTSSQGSR
jgi:hypothetical protein